MSETWGQGAPDERLRGRRPLLALVALLAWGCGNELELSAGLADAAPRDTVAVRTRPVCGNGVPETGEECDDGNAIEDDGCDSNCQAPCGPRELAVLGCGTGRTFMDRVELYSHSMMKWVVAEATRTTQICRTVEGATFEVAVCRNGNCLNILSPQGSGRACAKPCLSTVACPAGQVCVETWIDGDGVDIPEQERRGPGPQPTSRGWCLPSVGGGVGDRCGTCGLGLNCNEVAGLEDQFLCMPSCEADADCPGAALCSSAYSVHTGDPNGRSCFHSVNAPPGTRVDREASCPRMLALPVEVVSSVCEAGCAQVYDTCGACFQDDAGDCRAQSWCRAQCHAGGAWAFFACLADRGECGSLDACRGAETGVGFYCTVGCEDDTDCPTGGWTCADFGEGLGRRCVAPTPDALNDGSGFDLVPERNFPAPECADDVDAFCSFESACDVDCARTLGCGDVPGAGQCREDGSLVFCEQHHAVRIDCAARDRPCGFDAALSRFDCLEGQTP